MAQRKMTKLRLLAELRKLLSRPDTTVTYKRLRICGHSRWEYDDVTNAPIRIHIVVDPRRDGAIRVVLHELLHVYMDWKLGIGDKMVYEVEEEGILAWERLVYDYLHVPKREKLLESWNQAIGRKET